MSSIYGTSNKVSWFIRRFGWKELFLKPMRRVVAPWVIPRLPRNTLEIRYKSYPQEYHAYNGAWYSERMVEIPYMYGQVRTALRRNHKVLEVGNTLGHYYFPVVWDVVDKYEKSPHSRLMDIIDVVGKYDFIFSISTFEHIFFDEGYSDAQCRKHCRGAIHGRIEYCRHFLLNPGGTFEFTVPYGYNPYMDNLLQNEYADDVVYFHRAGPFTWAPGLKPGLKRFPYSNNVAFVKLKQ